MAMVHKSDWNYYFEQGPAYGSLEVSRDCQFVTPHFTIISPRHYRQGWGTKLVDEMFELAESKGLKIRWIDDHEYDGCGSFTEMGQAFADRYRVKRGIPLSWIKIINHRREYRDL